MIPDYRIEISDGVQPVAFNVVALVQDGDYSWSAEAVLSRVSDGALFFVTDAGCSCNGFAEYLTVADLQPLNKAEDAYKLTSDRERLQRSHESRDVVYR
jgi:hypothetical protein